jgi:hypothetical protein
MLTGNIVSEIEVKIIIFTQEMLTDTYILCQETFTRTILSEKTLVLFV